MSISHTNVDLLQQQNWSHVTVVHLKCSSFFLTERMKKFYLFRVLESWPVEKTLNHHLNTLQTESRSALQKTHFSRDIAQRLTVQESPVSEECCLAEAH